MDPFSSGGRLSAQRIYQDLRSEFQFQGSYQAVKRFVGSLKVAEPDRVWRIEVQPAEEAQVDFGLGAPLIDAEGKRRRSWVFRIVLSYSRRHFGGVPKTLNLDNLKAAGQLLAQIGTRYDTMEEALQAMARVQVNASRLTEYLTDVFKPSDPTDEGALVRTERNRDWAEHFFEEGKGNRPPGVRGPL